MRRVSASIGIGLVIGLITVFYTLLVGGAIPGYIVLAALPALLVRALGKWNFHERAIPVYAATAAFQLALLGSVWIIPDFYANLAAAMMVSSEGSIANASSAFIVAPVLTLLGLAAIYGYNRFV